MRTLKILTFVAAISTLVVGCSQDNPMTPGGADFRIQSPQATTALVGGFVFVDTDSNGVLDASEAGWGVGSITVYISDGLFFSTAVVTDGTGYYSAVVPFGTYTIEVSPVTPEADFNEGLFDSYDPSTVLSVVVDVPLISSPPPDTNFGFNPQVEEITEQLEQGDLETDGLSLEYWRRQFILALTKLNPPAFGQPNPEEPDYDAAQLLSFLNSIEGLAFVDPFMFPPGGELKAALMILGDPSGLPLPALLAEILTFELNHVAGFGIIGEPELQLTLINYSESVYIGGGGLSPSAKGVTFAPTGDLEDDVAKTKLMLQQVNRGGGGGPVQ